MLNMIKSDEDAEFITGVDAIEGAERRYEA
jgi:hypothetical protein